MEVKMNETIQNEKSTLPVDQGRRNAMQKIAISVGVLAGISVLPEQWTRPIIGQIVLPAHAGTSGSTLHDPCTVEATSGNQATTSVTIKVSGFVSPPTANLPVQITATASGGARNQMASQTTTNTSGAFEAIMTIGGGPGITAVAVLSSITGTDGVARCSVDFQEPATTPAPTTTAEPTTTSTTTTTTTTTTTDAPMVKATT